ncbi:hypothetical protein [Arthrobacter sp. BF1]|uniref:hypothetical protein n=1 Tax=Arthrobacter sp. BF1 TaxID=2821145 RepID=UPI001C5019F1|nr:hypothetical protein [Arthrobacter sp. BF1]
MIPSRTGVKIFALVALMIVVAVAVPIVLAMKTGLPLIWPILGTALTLVVSSVLLSPYLASKKSQRTPRSYPQKVYELVIESPLASATAFDRIEKLFASRKDVAIQRQNQELKITLGSDYKLRMYGVFSSSGRDALPIAAIVRAQNIDSGSRLEINCSDDLGWFVGKEGKKVMEVAEQKVRETAEQVANVVQRESAG